MAPRPNQMFLSDRSRGRAVSKCRMASGEPAATGDGVLRWLLPAAVLHVAILLVAAALSHGAAPAAARVSLPPSTFEEPESSIELTLLGDDEASSKAPVPPAPASHVQGAPRTNVRQGAIVALHLPQPDAPRRDESSQLPAAAASVTSAANEAPREASPTLALDQLGIGTNPFRGTSLAIEPLSKEERAQLRLQAALHPLDVEHERQRGLGPEGPVLNAARSLILAEDSLVETHAVVNVRVDARGRVTEVHLIDASSQIQAWQLIAARLAKALEPVTLRQAGSTQAWDMKLRLASRVQLPSGVTPGLRMGVLGQQVAGSGGPHSTSLELSPTAKLDLKEPIDSIGRHLDSPMRLEVILLKLKADLTNIGAPARRNVEVAVLSIDAPAAP
jgi:hypothetical protein